MSESFDPYYSWLGIPPAEQPADFYRLLGLSRFESNAEAITNSAERQMRHVRTFQLGENAGHSQTLLNEVATARACLLDSASKATYDQHLDAQRSEQNPPPVAPAIPAATSPAIQSRRRRPRNSRIEVVKIIVGGIVGLTIGVLLLWYGFGMDVLGVMQPPDAVTANPTATKTTVSKSTSTQELTRVVIDPDLQVGEAAAKPLAEQPSKESHKPPLQGKTDSEVEVAVEESTEHSVAAGTRRSASASFRNVVGKLQGTWEVTYANRTKHRRVIGADGHEPRSINGDIIIDFPVVIERLTLVGDKLFVEHFNPKSTYPNGFADVIGIGKKLNGRADSDSD